MEILIVTQIVDINDSILGFFHGWIEEFSKQCDKVTVVCLYEGKHNLPDNVKVLSLGKEGGFSRSKYLYRLYKYSWQERKNYSKVFVHMVPKYIISGWPIWRLLKKKIGMWYAHGHVALDLKIAEKLTDFIFTSTKSGCRLESKKINIVGQGIDTSLFKKNKQADSGDKTRLLTIGRISPSKDYETLIKVVKILKGKKIKCRLDIVGDVGLDEDSEYLSKLKEMVKRESVEQEVCFCGSIPNTKIIDKLNEADVFVSGGRTGSMDKAILEAMACELPVVVCNEAFKDILSDHQEELIYNPGDEKEMSEKVENIIKHGEQKQNELGRELRKLVVQEHNIEALIKKINKIYQEKRILFFINKFKRGGAERVFLNQINYLNKTGRDVYLGEVFKSSSSNHFFNELELSEKKIVSFNFKGIWDIKKYLELRNYIKRNNIDVIYATLETAIIIARFEKLLIPSLRVITRESGMADRKNMKNKTLDVIFNFLVHKIIAVSKDVKQSMCDYQNIYRDKIKVLLNGVKVLDWEEIQRRKIKTGKFRILCVGSMYCKDKGQGILIELMDDLVHKKGYKDIELVLVGDGRLKEKYIRMTEEKKLDNNVIFTGYIPVDKVNEYYLSSDLFMLLSKTEGCPNVVLEAMSFGLPVIVTKVSGAVDIVAEGKNGFFVNSQDHESICEHVYNLYKNNKLREKIGEQAYLNIKERFSIPVNAESIIKIVD